MRGPLAPGHLPISTSRGEVFDDLVRESVDRLRDRWEKRLEGVTFGVQDAPWPRDLPAAAPGEETVPLARLVPGDAQQPSRIVVFRHPVELRTVDRGERAALVHDLIVEQVADYLGLGPETVDPHYGQG